MMKQIAILARRDGATREAFQAHWSMRHAGLMAVLPGLVRYVQNDVLRALPRRHLPPLPGEIDGIEELWFRSAAALGEAATSSAAQTVLHDEPNFAGGKSVFTVHELVVYDGATDDAAPRHKRISMLRRRAPTTKAQFQSYWSTVHLELARAHRHADRYVQDHVIEAQPRGELPVALPEVDGFGEFATADLERMQGTYDTAAGRAMTEDAARFLDAVSTYLVGAREIALPGGRI